MLSRHSSILLIISLIILTVITYIHRTPIGDDAWFAEQSYWLLEDGVIRSEFFAGLNDWDKELLVSHKFFLWFGALLMFFFGYDLPVVQFTGFIFFLIMVAELIYYLRLRGEARWSAMILSLLFIIFANRLLVKMSFQNRPEMMLAALGFGSFLLLFTGNKNTTARVVAAGILSGLAFVAHMNGIIYILGGFITLSLLKRYQNAVLFGLTAFMSSLLYLVDIVDHPQGFSVWLFQFTNDPAASHGLDLTRKLVQLISYPRLFFYTPEQIAFSLLFVYVLWYQRALLKQVPSHLRIYFLTMFFSFWIITKGNAGQYMVLFIPFMIAILYELYQLRPFKSTALKALLVVYLVIGVFGMGQLIVKNWKYGDLPEDYEALRPQLPENQTGLVPLTFFFNEYEEYEQLISHENYKLHYNKEDLSAEQMAAWSQKKGVDFILYDYEFLREGYYPEPGRKQLPHYRLTFFDGRFAIYQRL